MYLIEDCHGSREGRRLKLERDKKKKQQKEQQNDLKLTKHRKRRKAA